MTSAQNGERVMKFPHLRTNITNFVNREGRGVKKSIKSVDVIYGSPIMALSGRTHVADTYGYLSLDPKAKPAFSGATRP